MIEIPKEGAAPKQQRSMLNRIRIDLKRAFKAAVNATAAFATADITKAGSAAADALSSVSISPLTLEEIANNLVIESLSSSISTILLQSIRDSLLTKQQSERIISLYLAEDALKVSTEDGWTLDLEFFQTPQNAEFLGSVIDQLREALVRAGVDGASAGAAVSRLPTYFTYALRETWASNPQIHQIVYQALDTPFSEAAAQETAWLRHQASIERQVAEPLYGTPHTLQQLFEPIYAHIDVQIADDDSAQQRQRPPSTQTNLPRPIVLVAQELDDWVNGAGNCEVALRVISGGPGSGKSSAARMWSVSASKRGHRVLYVPLHHLAALNSDLSTILESYCRGLGFPRFPLDPSELSSARPITVLLDGLDEIAMEGKAALRAASDFVQWVDRLEGRLNFQCDPSKPKVRFLMGGREIVVQECAAVINRPGQVISLLPYSEVTISQIQQSEYRDLLRKHENLLWEKPDQRDSWWSRFGAATAQEFRELPQQFRQEKLDDVTSQPLLNFLLAHRYTISLTTDGAPAITDRFSLYESLLRDVLERRWDKGKNPGTDLVRSFDRFARVLEEIALATWHGDTRGASLRTIQDYCASSNIGLWLTDFSTASREGLAGFMVSFYFRQAQRQNGEESFEFTHKSFAEYLVARRLLGALNEISEDVEPRGARPSRVSVEDALATWADLTGLGTITDDMHPWIEGACGRIGDGHSPELLHQTLEKLITSAINDGTNLANCKRRPHRSGDLALFIGNSESSLMIFRSIFSLKSGIKTRIYTDSSNLFGNWLSRMLSPEQKLRGTPLQQGIRSYLSNIDFGRIDPESQQWVHSDIDISNLNLSGANMAGWICRRLQLQDCILHHTHLLELKSERLNLYGCRGTTLYISGSTTSGILIAGCSLPGLIASNIICSGHLFIASYEDIPKYIIGESARPQGAYITWGSHNTTVALPTAPDIENDLSGSTFSRSKFKEMALGHANIFNSNILSVVPKSFRHSSLLLSNKQQAILNRKVREWNKKSLDK